MKKTILSIIIVLTILSCSTTKTVENKKKTDSLNEKPITYDYADKIGSEKLNFIKKTYNWNNEKILIINYSQPINSCHFDNNKITSESKKWWNDFYSKIDTEDCLNIKVLANGERVKNKLDNLNYFDDKNDFLLINFFGRKKSCFGILIINNEGHYIQFNGHYSEKQVAIYIENLKK
ncbi:hypothetical protein [uncultured Dokdonia sp.]|uniref:hypothetical protein n=1 Tax=uncultured Dokdonia sp. TaxID=575653 RepID=UPI00260B14A9|nr:hypothetical protein [uncultured Dokdonia sp.]